VIKIGQEGTARFESNFPSLNPHEKNIFHIGYYYKYPLLLCMINCISWHKVCALIFHFRC